MSNMISFFQGTGQRSGRMLCAMLFFMFCVSFIVNLSYKFNTISVKIGPDLCTKLDDRVAEYNSEKNSTKQWWEWACLLEREWDKGNEYECDDSRDVANYKICFDGSFAPKEPCLVYSFGIDNDFRFDDKMAEYGCEVFAFDPSMNVASHWRSERVKFINMGLSTFDDDHFIPVMDGYTIKSNKKWKIKTLHSIRKMLGHEKRPLDILKIDIESYEWFVIKHLLDTGELKYVKQLTLEWHIFPNEPMRTSFHEMYNTYKRLKDAGFRQFYSSSWARYHNIKYFNSQEDNSLVNFHFTPPA